MGIPLGTFRRDNPNPTMQRLIYLTFDRAGSVRLHMSPLGVDGQRYRGPSLSTRKHSRGSVKTDYVDFFQDLAGLSTNGLAQWAFARLKSRA